MAEERIREALSATVAVRNPNPMNSFDSSVNPSCAKFAEEPLIDAGVFIAARHWQDS